MRRKTLLFQKLVALLCHCVASALFMLCVASLVWRGWYRDYLFTTDGGLQGLTIVTVVLLVLGPFLTFVVYKRGKQGLKVDLSIIVILQFLGMLYGVYQTYYERPLLMVLYGNQFKTVNFNAMELNDIPRSIINHFPGDFPKKVFVPLQPEGVTNLDTAIKELLKKGHIHARYDLYRPLNSDEGRSYLKKNGELKKTELIAQLYGKELDRRNLEPTEKKNIRYFLFSGKYGAGILGIHLDTFEEVSFDLLDPSIGSSIKFN